MVWLQLDIHIGKNEPQSLSYNIYKNLLEVDHKYKI